MIIPYLLDTSYTLKGQLDNFVSLIWTSRYFEGGDFELVLPINDFTLGNVTAGSYIIRSDTDEFGIIEKVELITSEDEPDRMIISGKLGNSILGRRIISTRLNYKNKTVGEVVEGIIDKQIITPFVAARAISNFQYFDDTTQATTINKQFTGDNLEEAIKELCLTYGLGYKVVFNRTNNIFECHLYEGVDRSFNQAVNDRVIFSTRYSNLASVDYIEDYSGMITDVLVAGEGEGSSRVTQWATISANTGLNRYEAYEDARNTTSEGMTTAEYKATLLEQGLEAITKVMAALGGEAILNNYKYRQDFNVGDIVTVEVPTWQLTANVRIIEVIESVSEGGTTSVIPTFSL